MKRVIFTDGRELTVDADFMMCPGGVFQLMKRKPEPNGSRAEAAAADLEYLAAGNVEVRSYPSSEVRNVVDVVVPPIKVLAIKLLTACSVEPHGSRKLAELAGIEYSDVVIPILKKLRDAGKVSFADGKWTRA